MAVAEARPAVHSPPRVLGVSPASQQTGRGGQGLRAFPGTPAEGATAPEQVGPAPAGRPTGPPNPPGSHLQWAPSLLGRRTRVPWPGSQGVPAHLSPVSCASCIRASDPTGQTSFGLQQKC